MEFDELERLLDGTPLDLAAAVPMGEKSREDIRTYAGETVRSARAFWGLSQRDLARRSGVPHSVIAEIESARRQPSIPTLARILRGAGFDLRLELVAYDPHDDDLEAEEAAMTADLRQAVENLRQ